MESLYTPTEQAFFNNIKNEDDLLVLMQQYVLDTVSSMIKMFHQIPEDAPVAAFFDFVVDNGLCTAHHARWDILAMPANRFNAIPIVVIFIPPGEFGLEDFAPFIEEQTFDTGWLDRLRDSKSKPRRRCLAPDIIWAVIYDICRTGIVHRFVLTNYLRWVFGEMNEDFTEARVTPNIEASVMGFSGASLNGTTSDLSPALRSGGGGLRVVELLVYWIQCGRGVVGPKNKFRTL